jgi:hypothetical protein
LPEFWGRFRERIPIAALTPGGQGLVAGLLQKRDGAWFLQDSSGAYQLPQAAMDGLGLNAPAWIALHLVQNGQVDLSHYQPLQLAPEQLIELARADRLRQRLAIHGEIRNFFREQTFLEVDTPWLGTLSGYLPGRGAVAAHLAGTAHEAALRSWFR